MQHSFIPGRSCLTNLLTFLARVTSYIDSGFPVDVIYLDFSKAIDKVPHERLLIQNVLAFENLTIAEIENRKNYIKALWNSRYKSNSNKCKSKIKHCEKSKATTEPK